MVSRVLWCCALLTHAVRGSNTAERSWILSRLQAAEATQEQLLRAVVSLTLKLDSLETEVRHDAAVQETFKEETNVDLEAVTTRLSAVQASLSGLQLDQLATLPASFERLQALVEVELFWNEDHSAFDDEELHSAFDEEEFWEEEQLYWREEELYWRDVNMNDDLLDDILFNSDYHEPAAKATTTPTTKNDIMGNYGDNNGDSAKNKYSSDFFADDHDY
jgi:hypothetical protein